MPSSSSLDLSSMIMKVSNLTYSIHTCTDVVLHVLDIQTAQIKQSVEQLYFKPMVSKETCYYRSPVCEVGVELEDRTDEMERKQQSRMKGGQGA